MKKIIIEKNGENAFSAEVDMPLIDIVPTDIGYLHFNNVTKFPVRTDTLRKYLAVKGPDNLQNQGKIGSANIHKKRRSSKFFFTKQLGMTGIILFPGFGFCIAQNTSHCTVFAVCYLEKNIEVEEAL